MEDLDEVLDREKKYECEVCKDTRYVNKNGKVVKCVCQLKKELKSYLDSELLGIDLNKKINIHEYGNNLLFDKVKLSVFKKVLKGFLVKSYLMGVKYDYGIIQGSDIIESYLGDSSHQEYALKEFIILKLGRDYPNKAMEDVMKNILSYRVEHNLLTWVYVYQDCDEAEFKRLYGDGIRTMAYSKDFKLITVKKS